MQELLSAISEAVVEEPATKLENFLEEVALLSEVDEEADNHNSVTLMTIHAAKGLEFPVVFITGLEEGLFPLYNTALDKQDLEEERRLFYVGITRAKQKLYLTHARTRFRFGDVSNQTPSRFIEEIGGEHIESFIRPRTHAESSMYSQYGGQSQRAAMRTPRPAKQPFFDDATPDYENESDVMPQLRIGATVEHEVFGRGRVLSLSGKGDAMKAVVEFASIGRKNLLLKYASLRLV